MWRRLTRPPPSPLAGGALASASSVLFGRSHPLALAPTASRQLASWVDPRETREGVRRRQNFWRKWGELSQQEFWQDVGFDHDRAKDMEMSGLARARKKKGAPSGEPEDYREGYGKPEADEYFDTEDALDVMAAGEMEDFMGMALADAAAAADGLALDSAGFGTRAGAERMRHARDALLRATPGGAGAGLTSSRRAELLGLLEDLGPEGLLGPRPMPEEKLGRGDATALLQEDLSKSIQTTRNYIDALKLRADGNLPAGSYYAYLLNTRRVAKVSAEGKRMSYSCLVVVGNGQGTAGIGMGKDITPGNALYKATRTARNSLIHIDRFDDRTLFHAINDRYAKTKLVIRLRRPGSGTRCAWHVWKMLSAIGVSDVSVKIHGSRNPTTVAYALFNALQRQSTAQDVADRRGVRVLDMDPREIRYPGY